MTAAGYVVKQITLTIDAVAYECAVISCVLTAQPNVITWQTSCADGQGADTGLTSYTLDLEVATSPDPDGLARILFDNDGQVLAFTFVPDGINWPAETVSGDVRAQPVPFGGTAGSLASASVSLPVVGVPVWTP